MIYILYLNIDIFLKKNLNKVVEAILCNVLYNYVDYY